MLSCLPLLATAVGGQTARIKGRVYDEVTGTPVPQAVVRIVGTSLQTRTDRDGGYAFDQVPAGRISLRVELDGYTPLVQHLDIYQGESVIASLDIAPVAVLLERLMARALPDPEEAASKATVRGDNVSGRGGKTGEAVARVPGARVLFSGGAVGSVTQILVRGIKSLSLPGEPLYYVDGLPVSPPTAPTARNRAGEPSILDLLDASTIERIEVLSGAAASAVFGLGSNNGVILIYTKR